MLKFMSLSSGSCGNCYFLGWQPDEETPLRGILIDAGVSLRALKRNLRLYGLSFDNFDAILVTHDHFDHIRHLGSFCSHLHKPVYASRTLHDALSRHFATRDAIVPCRKYLQAGEWNTIPVGSGSLRVRYFVVPHDATETCGFFIRFGGENFVLMTDVGRVTPESLEYARQADTLVIESNYDTQMLIGGPYPHQLKMRICGGYGHMSNDECAGTIKHIWHDGLRNIFLCHLSENNNTPEAAFASAARALVELGVKETVRLQTLPRQTATPLILL